MMGSPATEERTGDITPDEVVELRQCDALATKGPWVWHTGCSWRRLSSVDLYEHQDGNVICPTNNPHDMHVDLIVDEHDMDIIVKSRNMLGRLLDTIERQRTRIAELEADRVR